MAWWCHAELAPVRWSTTAAVAAAAVVAGIAVVGIVGDCPNFAAVVVDAGDPQVGYTPCGTWENHR
jgi:hypothetical protein